MKTFLKILLLPILLGVFLGGLCACQQQNVATTKIGIVLPLEHKALQEIVAGFTDKLHAIYHQPLQIKVMNAQGDINMQRAIIQQMRDQNYAMIVPVATSVTQMTAAMIHQQPIVSLAADFSEQNRRALHPCNIAVVDDEIPPQKLIAFIHAAYPTLTHLVLIHSTSDKIFPDVKVSIAAGKLNNIEIKPLMVATLPELVSATAALPADTQGIFILKDNLIASGIATLAQVAKVKHIPLMTSDQGTVQVGAGFAIGVHERQIGEEGALLAKAVLSGQPISGLPITKMQNLSVFINKSALQQEDQDTARLIAVAKDLHYNVEFVEGK